LDRMLEFVDGQAASAHLDSKARREVRLACEEALVNVIDHAYQGQTGVLHIDIVPGDHQLQITIRDTGGAFDPRSVPEPDILATATDRRVGGLGVHLIRNLVDTFDYHRRQGENILTLIKRSR
jgi:anti-sigma regulatory factor (Ser/Thr protein kinase)